MIDSTKSDKNTKKLIAHQERPEPSSGQLMESSSAFQPDSMHTPKQASAEDTEAQDADCSAETEIIDVHQVLSKPSSNQSHGNFLEDQSKITQTLKHAEEDDIEIQATSVIIIFDTNVLIDNPEVLLDRTGDDTFSIINVPPQVINELEKHKENMTICLSISSMKMHDEIVIVANSNNPKDDIVKFIVKKSNGNKTGTKGSDERSHEIIFPPSEKPFEGIDCKGGTMLDDEVANEVKILTRLKKSYPEVKDCVFSLTCLIPESCELIVCTNTELKGVTYKPAQDVKEKYSKRMTFYNLVKDGKIDIRTLRLNSSFASPKLEVFGWNSREREFQQLFNLPISDASIPNVYEHPIDIGIVQISNEQVMVEANVKPQPEYFATKISGLLIEGSIPLECIEYQPKMSSSLIDFRLKRAQKAETALSNVEKAKEKLSRTKRWLEISLNSPNDSIGMTPEQPVDDDRNAIDVDAEILKLALYVKQRYEDVPVLLVSSDANFTTQCATRRIYTCSCEHISTIIRGINEDKKMYLDRASADKAQASTLRRALMAAKEVENDRFSCFAKPRCDHIIKPGKHLDELQFLLSTSDLLEVTLAHEVDDNLLKILDEISKQYGHPNHEDAKRINNQLKRAVTQLLNLRAISGSHDSNYSSFEINFQSLNDSEYTKNANYLDIPSFALIVERNPGYVKMPQYIKEPSKILEEPIRHAARALNLSYKGREERMFIETLIKGYAEQCLIEISKSAKNVYSYFKDKDKREQIPVNDMRMFFARLPLDERTLIKKAVRALVAESASSQPKTRGLPIIISGMFNVKSLPKHEAPPTVAQQCFRELLAKIYSACLRYDKITTEDIPELQDFGQFLEEIIKSNKECSAGKTINVKREEIEALHLVTRHYAQYWKSEIQPHFEELNAVNIGDIMGPLGVNIRSTVDRLQIASSSAGIFVRSLEASLTPGVMKKESWLILRTYISWTLLRHPRDKSAPPLKLKSDIAADLELRRWLCEDDGRKWLDKMYSAYDGLRSEIIPQLSAILKFWPKSSSPTHVQEDAKRSGILPERLKDNIIELDSLALKGREHSLPVWLQELEKDTRNFSPKEFPVLLRPAIRQLHELESHEIASGKNDNSA